MSLPSLPFLSRTFTEMSSACAAATPCASWKDDDMQDGILPPTDTLEDEVQLLQETIDEFFVRLRQLLEKLEKRTTA